MRTRLADARFPLPWVSLFSTRVCSLQVLSLTEYLLHLCRFSLQIIFQPLYSWTDMDSAGESSVDDACNRNIRLVASASCNPSRKFWLHLGILNFLTFLSDLAVPKIDSKAVNKAHCVETGKASLRVTFPVKTRMINKRFLSTQTRTFIFPSSFR